MVYLYYLNVRYLFLWNKNKVGKNMNEVIKYLKNVGEILHFLHGHSKILTGLVSLIGEKNGFKTKTNTLY